MEWFNYILYALMTKLLTSIARQLSWCHTSDLVYQIRFWCTSLHVQTQILLSTKVFAIAILWSVGPPWSKALMNAALHGHLLVFIWLCENGEACTMELLRIAMHRNNLPMVQYMVRCGVLRAQCQPFENGSFGDTWIDKFCDKNLAVEAYVFDTAFGGKLSAARLKEAVKHAISQESVLALKWLQQKGIRLHVASAEHYAVWRHSHSLNCPGVRRLLDWLDAQWGAILSQ